MKCPCIYQNTQDCRPEHCPADKKEVEQIKHHSKLEYQKSVYRDVIELIDRRMEDARE